MSVYDKTWLITGGSGFLGRPLLDELERRANGSGRIITTVRRERPPIAGIEQAVLDLKDEAAVGALIERIQPDVVVHLAGRTPPAPPEELFEENTLATLQLLQALQNLGRDVQVVIAGSAAELGPVDQVPTDEDQSPRPRDAYGKSKYASTLAGLLAGPPLDVRVARVFNPIGRGMSNRQALGRFVLEIASAPKDQPFVLEVGDLSARRDFIDVRDVATALLAIAERGRPSRLYHVGTGISHSVSEGMERLIEISGRSVIVRQADNSGAARGPNESRANISRLTSEIGWSPAWSWEESLRDLWAWASERASSGSNDCD